MTQGYESVIGLEVHAQLKTRTKIFCGCATGFGAAPNSQTCEVCLGHPGALPVLNGRAVELAVRAAVALGCTIHERSVFARKNYFYPDLPKGYQISQYEAPLASGGAVEFEGEAGARSVGLIRLHLEEDAGKSIHDGMPDSDRHAYVDLNRAGVPLIEIVSRPELRGPEEAYLFLQRLRSVLRYTDVCEGNLEEGSLRCDANVSVRRAGERVLGTRTELKNLNSFRNVQRALDYEIGRQVEIVRGGGTVIQETVLWDAGEGVTRPMRGKEEAHDYRYFPDPDLPALLLPPSYVDEIRAGLPELPAARKRRFAERYGLSGYEAQLLTLEPELADYFERVAELSRNPKASSNWILNDLLRAQKNDRAPSAELRPAAEHLAELIGLIDAGTVSVTVARQELFPEMYRAGRAPEELVRERGLEQLSDETALRALVESVLAAHPQQVAQYRGGKTGLFGFLVGQVLRASGGKANPRTVDQLLRKLLE